MTKEFLNIRNKFDDNISLIEAVYYEKDNLLELVLGAEDISPQIEYELKETLYKSLDLDISIEWIIKKSYDFDMSYINKLSDHIISKFPKLFGSSEIIYNEETSGLNLFICNSVIDNYIKTNKVTSYIKEKVYFDCNKDIDIEVYLNNDICLDEFINSNKIIEDSISKEKLESEPVKLTIKKDSQIDRDFSIGKKIKEAPLAIEDLNDETFWVTIQGNIYNIETRPIKDNKYIVSFFIHDNTSATSCKAFWSEELFLRFENNVKEDDNLIVSGRYQMDSYSKSYVLTIDSMAKAEKEIILDTSDEKRVELRIHTQMSNSEGFLKVKNLYKKLEKWGHKAVAITDLDVVQSFPEAMNLGEASGIKTIYGLDANMVYDEYPIVSNFKETESYVVFDIETTGLANQYDKITEIGAVKIRDKEIIDSYSSLVNPQMQISDKIVNLTGITNEMVEKERTIDQVLPEFLEFCKDSTLVAHNAEFDISHIRTNCENLGLNFNFPFIDTLYLARFLLPELKNHKLNTLAKHLNVRLINHHRAVDDAVATANVFINLFTTLEDRGLVLDESINSSDSAWPKMASNNFNALILARTREGLKNLYKIVSESHTKSLYKGPKIPLNFLKGHREGLLIGSGNINGRLYKAFFESLPMEEIERIANDYDFLEVQPSSNFTHMVANSDMRTGISSIEFIEKINKNIAFLGEKLSLPVVATGDVYYLDKQDSIYREIVKSVKFNRPTKDSKNLYLKTTRDMLEEFAYLGKSKAYEIVIKNTNLIADMVEDNFRAIPKGKFAPKLEGAEEELRTISYQTAREIYGDKLPKIVEDRLEVELNSIISNGYSVLYIIARKLVMKSNEDGYVVGSRGSVGSSLVATMTGITEVNPLAAHYICPKCKNSEFFVKENYDTGLDMDDKLCPKCSTKYRKDGHNIPFEVFLGFKGNKEPDIDLNFASEYQTQVHKYTEELFGKDYVYRAGTIGTIAENTAYGFIKKYYEKEDKNISPAQVAYLQKGIVGTKRTTGQHPGGIMIVPYENEMEDFAPINHPADDMNSDVRTTHFAYSSIDETILKLDLLGHDVPSIIKRLQELTSIDPSTIDLTDQKTMSIFSSMDALELKEEITEKNVGTLGIPEFGTNFVRQMLKDTKPSAMGELFRISGLSHGTDVWLNNAQDLVRDGRAVLGEVICTRDDIMTFLIQKGMESNEAFTIMERVRKGKGLTDEQIILMNDLDLPDWYIDSCQKIKYMFPKAHATAYVLMSYRIAYFKVHQAPAFYATFFTTKMADFPGSIIFKGLSAIREEMLRIKDLGYEATNKDTNTYNVLEVAEEMLARGYEFEKPALNQCQASAFSLSKDGKVIVPYCAIEEVSTQQSIDIFNACKEGKFISIENLISRTGINKTAVEGLKREGLLVGLQDTNQIDIFSMLD